MNYLKQLKSPQFGLHYLKWLFLGGALLLVIHYVPAFISLSYLAKDEYAKSVLKQMIQEQQQSYLQQGTFLDASQLKPGRAVAGYEQVYRFSTRRLDNRVYSYAVPFPEYQSGRFLIFPWNQLPWLNSYVGVVLVTDRKTRATQAGICHIRSLDAELTLTEVQGTLSCRSASR